MNIAKTITIVNRYGDPKGLDIEIEKQIKENANYWVADIKFQVENNILFAMLQLVRR